MLLDQASSIDAGKLTIFPIADSQSHAFRVRISLPEQDIQLYPGMLVKTAFVVNELERLFIPAQSLVKRSEVTAVYVVDSNQQIQFRQVRTGIIEGDRVEIVAGLDNGELVAIDPIQAGIQLKTSRAAQ